MDYRALPMPWVKIPGLFTDGPAEPISFDLNGHRFYVAPTGDHGHDTGRGRFLVRCETCGRVLHENTTGPRHYIQGHFPR